MKEYSEQELEEAKQDVVRKGEVYRHYAFALEIYRSKYDRYLAQVKMEIKKELHKEGERVSEAEIERNALASEKWTEIDSKAIAFLEAAGRAKIDYEVAKMVLDTARTQSSTRRTEMQVFKG